MADVKPWGAIDPNSQHQLWSHWTFTVYEGGRHAPYPEVCLNVRRWLRQGFGSMGELKAEERLQTARLPDGTPVPQTTYVIEVRVEGVPAHDPDYVASVRRQFLTFIAKGWGPLGTGSVQVKVLAGDRQDGTPRQQLIVGAFASSS